MEADPIPMIQMQLAFAISILGVYFGWRGVIAKMTGFYDLSGAVRYLLYGIVAGVFLALAVDQLILSVILEESTSSQISIPLLAIFSFSLLIGAGESSFVLFLVGRPGVASIRASPPFGWALGLGLGSMQSAYLIVRLFDSNPSGLAALSSVAGFNTYSIALASLISILSSLGHALPATWQGNQLIGGSRVVPLIISTFVRASIAICLVLSIIKPIFSILILPFVILFWFRAQEIWLPSGLTPAARQAFRRTIRQSELHKKRADDRIRGESLESEE